MQQLQAGYIASSAHQKLKQWASDSKQAQALSGLLGWLSTFDFITTAQLERAKVPHPLLAVAHNLLVRGQPTLPSVWLEEQLAQTLALTQRIDRPETGEIQFSFAGEGPSGEALFQALHPIVPQVSPHEFRYDMNDVDSGFERAFIFDYSAKHPYLAQILQKQRPLASLVWKPKHGRVDFSLEIPYWQESQKINRFKRSVKIAHRKSFIVETDGKAYHAQHIDSARDFATQAMGHDTSRITEDDAIAEAQSFMEKIAQEEFVQRTRDNFQNPGYATSRLTLLVLQPFAIARIQRIVLNYLMSRHWLEGGADLLRVAILERDIPAGALAMEDLLRTFRHLQALADDLPPLPQLEWNSFDQASRIDFNAYDLVIDHSMLRRAGIFAEDRELSSHPKVVQVRTAHFTGEDTITSVVSASPIRYKDLGQVLDNGRFEPDEAQVVIATAFLQDIFRKQAFREGQLPILNRAFQRKSVIGLLPTGGGKSLTYQLAALLQPGITIVVDPIRSLMVDQDRGLRKVLIDKTAFLNSSLSSSERVYIQKQLLPRGALQFVFVSPERFVIQEFRDMLALCGQNRHYYAFTVIDEAHCVSEWGHDFRIPYLNLGVNAQEYCPTWDKRPVPLFGLTATASFDVLADIERELQIQEDDGHAIVRAENTVRDEINYQIVAVAANLADGAIPNIFNTKEAVGKAKQTAVFERIALKETALDLYNDPEAIRRCTDQTVNAYLDTAARQRLDEEAAAAGAAAEDLYYAEKLARLRFPSPQEAFRKDEAESYRYGIVVFAPHRTGTLGINGEKGLLRNADHTEFSDDANLPHAYVAATGDTMGFFMGSSEEDPKKAEKIDVQSFAHMDRFLEGQNSVMVATKAFGMGIDKPDIRHAMHLNLPASIESYVQEAGRAGRDGKVALSTIFFNDTQFPIGAQRHHVDAEVLHYFHQRSFKGQMKEQAMIYELRNEISLPAIKRQAEICRQLAEEFPDFSEWKLSVWEKEERRRLYVNVAEFEGHNYINLVNDTPHADDMPLEVLHKLKDLVIEAPLAVTADLKKWLNELAVPPTTTTGIEKQFWKMLEGQKGELVVYFTNRYYSPEKKGDDFELNPAHLSLVENQALAKEIPELQVNTAYYLTQAVKEQESLAQYLQHFKLDETVRNRIINPESPEPQVRKFQRAFYAGRSKADTDKAIYRLTCIGVIDTYTIDYQNNCYHLHFTKQPEIRYFDNLRAFLARYTSKRQAEKLVDDLQRNSAAAIESQQATALGVCLSFLTNYIYDNIRLKRQRAIEDMLALCRNAVELSDPIEQNLFIKDEIYYYFNAKFSRPGMTETIGGKETPISLIDDVTEAVYATGDLIEKYLDIVEASANGRFIDNIKHLRGSTMRLLRSFPNEPGLMILKSFSLFALGNILPSLLREAQEELTKGLVQWHLQSGNDFAPLAFIEKFRLRLDKHVDQYDLLEKLQDALEAYFVDYCATWLHQFNNQLLNAYV
jgi:ATP-dependent DNA helicase RecQ